MDKTHNTPKQEKSLGVYLKIGFGALLVFLGSLGVYTYFGGKNVEVAYTIETGKWQTRAQECYAKVDVEISGCIINLVGTVADSGDVGAAVAVLEQSMGKSQDIVGKCHNAAHVIGRTAVRLGGTLTRVYEMPFSDCRFGLYHGALEEHTTSMNRAELLEKLNDLCAYFGGESSAATQECVHVLGHFVFDRSGDDISKAVSDCAAFVEPTLRSRCVDGTLMQATDVVRASVGKPADMERSEKIWGTDRKYQTKLLTSICENMDIETVKYVCYTNAPQTLSVLWDADYPQIHKYCATTTVRQACYEGIAASGFTVYSWDPEKITKACYAGTSDGAKACINSMAFSYSIVSGEEGSRDVCKFVTDEHQGICLEGKRRGLGAAGTIVQNQIDAREDYKVFNK